MWSSFGDILGDIHETRRRLLDGKVTLEVVREEHKLFSAATKVLQLQLQHASLSGKVKAGELADVALGQARSVANLPPTAPQLPPPSHGQGEAAGESERAPIGARPAALGDDEKQETGVSSPPPEQADDWDPDCTTYDVDDLALPFAQPDEGSPVHAAIQRAIRECGGLGGEVYAHALALADDAGLVPGGTDALEAELERPVAPGRISRLCRAFLLSREDGGNLSIYGWDRLAAAVRELQEPPARPLTPLGRRSS